MKKHYALLGMVTCLASAPLLAEDTARAGSDDTLAEIVVTAEKRPNDAQRTPIVMDIVSGDLLAQKGVMDMKGLATVAPEVNIVTNTIYTQVGIRGVSSQDVSETADPAITIGIDGEYLAHPIALNAAFFDISRVEVLSGPQGTLYGRNATAGAINIVTNKPSLEQFSGAVSVAFGNDSSVDSQGFVNIPIGETLALRAAFMTTRHDGYTDNGPAGHGDNADVQAARLGLFFKPDDRLSVYLAGEYVHLDQDAPSQYGVLVNASEVDSSGKFTGSPAHFNPTLPDGSGYPLPDLGYLRSNQGVLRGNISYDFGWSTLTYTGGYRDARTSALQPLQGFVPTFPPAFYGFSADDNTLDFKTQSHELRLSGQIDRRFFWQTGAFYSWDTQDVETGLFFPANTVVAPFLPPFFQNAYVNYFLLPKVDSQSMAEFAQASVMLTDSLKLTAGARYTHDEKSRVGYDAAGPAPGFSYPDRPTLANIASAPGYTTDFGEGTWNKTTWTVGLDEQLSPANFLYAKVATGYKAGGFDNFYKEFGPYLPESLTDYEIGSKNRFLDERIQYNVGFFYYDYSNLQTPVFLSAAGGSHTYNAGKATEYGIENEFRALVTRADTLSLRVNYLRAYFNSLLASPNIVGGNPGPPISLAGNSPVQAPKWTISGSLDHVWWLPAGVTLDLNLTTRFKSDYYLQPFNWEADLQKSHTISDAALTFATGGEQHWDVQAYVHNIEGTRELTYSAFTTAGPESVYNWIFGPPRTYGVRFGYHW